MRRPIPQPLLIAHRGASGYLPEHTLAAYELAARQGADYLEPDVVVSRDGVLVVRHENDISGTTDVADRPEFADRRATKVVDGVDVTGWFTEDFTVAELKTLRARERLPQLRGTAHDGGHPIATLEEVLDLRERLSREFGRDLGVYVETKHPTYFAELGLAMEEPLLAALERSGLADAEAPAWIQSFELGNLLRLRRELGSTVRATLLATSFEEGPYDLVVAGDPRTYADLLSPDSLAALAQDIEGVGPSKTMVLPWSSDPRQARPTTLVQDAHAAGLVVHAWTFRADNRFLPAALAGEGGPGALGDLATEIRAHLDAGLDGIFTDHPDLGVAARDTWVASDGR